QFSQRCAGVWKQLSDHEKKAFIDLALHDKIRYLQEIESWEMKMMKSGHFDVLRRRSREIAMNSMKSTNQTVHDGQKAHKRNIQKTKRVFIFLRYECCRRRWTRLHRQPKQLNEISWDSIKYDGLPSDCFAVVALQGTTLLKPFRKFNQQVREEIYSSRIDTMRTLTSAISKMSNPSQVSVLVSMSGVGFYPPSVSMDYTESWTDKDNNESNKDFIRTLSIDWEETSKPPNTTRHVILRLGLVLGKDGGLIKSLYPSFWFGFGSTFSDGSQWFPWIHVDDVASLIVEAIISSSMKGIYNLVAPSDPITNAEFAKEFARSFSPSRPMILSTPKFALNLMFGAELTNSVICSGLRVRSERITADLPDFRFKYSTIQEACSSFHS
ncbi:hypothetical protein GJ496_001317, partial [Pomphorhynchus laevis]